MVVFCDRYAPHAYGTHPQNPWTLLWVHFTGAFLEHFSKAFNTENSCRIISIGYNEKIIQNMHQIISLLNTSDEYLERATAYSYLKVCLCEMLLLEQQKRTQNLSIHGFIHESIEVMQRHINDHITLDELCNTIGLSKYYFSRQFKLATGVSPMTYFSNLKIQKACTLLNSNAYRTQEISAMLGFSTPYYFSETFKQFTGFSPRDYKKLQQSKY